MDAMDAALWPDTPAASVGADHTDMPRHVPSDVFAFLAIRLPIPATLSAALRQLYEAQHVYEWAQHESVQAAAEFYEWDHSAEAIKQDAIARLITAGATKTEAPKLAETRDAQYMAHLVGLRRAGARKADAERWLGVARRRHTTACVVVQAMVLDGSADLMPTTEAVGDLSRADAPNTDGQ